MEMTRSHTAPSSVAPEAVEGILSQHLLAKGMLPMVLDMKRSQGVHLYDRLTGRRFFDFFGFYASNALGMNHPKLRGDAAFVERLQEAALNKVANSDVRTTHLARFVDTFSRVGIPDYLPYAFFISGGSMAIENALKTAFDWKVRKNFQKGYRREVGQQVLHLDQAFHGRSGYTLSLTNTADPVKTKHFPKFDWPRILNPKIHFPLTDGRLEDLERREGLALEQAKRHFHERRDDIACVILEPIQGEGGDNHFRPRVPPGAPRPRPRERRPPHFRRGADGRRHHRAVLGAPGAGRPARHHRLRQENAGLRHLGRTSARRGRGPRLPRPQPDQLDLGRQPRRHGPLRPHP